jgi:hypothetical protein
MEQSTFWRLKIERRGHNNQLISSSLCYRYEIVNILGISKKERRAQ